MDRERRGEREVESYPVAAAAPPSYLSAVARRVRIYGMGGVYLRICIAESGKTKRGLSTQGKI